MRKHYSFISTKVSNKRSKVSKKCSNNIMSWLETSSMYPLNAYLILYIYIFIS